MLWFRIEILFCASLLLIAQPVRYGVGRTATNEEVSAWDIAVGPKGKELPAGQGTAIEGERIYARKCEHCHGRAGIGGKFDPLAGGGGTLATKQPVKTVGSYWPYATTVWDYINRATPQGEIGSLSHSEVYSVAAYLLHLNGIIRPDEVMNSETLPNVRMPNRGGFKADARPDWKDGNGARRTGNNRN